MSLSCVYNPWQAGLFQEPKEVAPPTVWPMDGSLLPSWSPHKAMSGAGLQLGYGLHL